MRRGNGRDTQIHRPDPYVLFAEREELFRSGMIKRQHLSSIEVSDDLLKFVIAFHNAFYLLCLSDVGVPAEKLLVETDDREVEACRWVFRESGHQLAELGLGLLLENADVIGVEDEHQSSSSPASANLSPEAQDFRKVRIILK